MIYGTSDAITAVIDSIRQYKKNLSTLDYEYFRRNGLNSLLTGGAFENKFNFEFINSYTKAITQDKNENNNKETTFFGRPSDVPKTTRKTITQFSDGYFARKSNSKSDPVVEAFGRASKRGLIEQNSNLVNRFNFTPCKIFYLLDGINIAAVANKTGPRKDSIVASEIRYLYRLVVKDNISFPYLNWVLNGKYTCAPWEGPTSKLWDNYEDHLNKKQSSLTKK